MASSLLELQSLYNEVLVKEIMDKTNQGLLAWSHLGGTQFRATEVVTSVTWDFYITKSQVGTLSYKYSLDVKRNSTAYLSLIDGPLPHTDRESGTKELYEIIEISVLDLSSKVKETIRMIQDIA